MPATEAATATTTSTPARVRDSSPSRGRLRINRYIMPRPTHSQVIVIATRWSWAIIPLSATIAIRPIKPASTRDHRRRTTPPTQAAMVASSRVTSTASTQGNPEPWSAFSPGNRKRAKSRAVARPSAICRSRSPKRAASGSGMPRGPSGAAGRSEPGVLREGLSSCRLAIKMLRRCVGFVGQTFRRFHVKSRGLHGSADHEDMRARARRSRPSGMCRQ